MYASIIIPIQVVDNPFAIFLEHLAYSVYSATKQTSSCEIIIVDYNSNTRFIPQIKHIAKQQALYIRDERSDTLWSRGRALNVGINCAKADLLLFVDADCVLPSNYAAEHLEAINKNIFTYSEFYLTAPTIHKTGNYDALIIQKNELRPPYATCCSHQGVLQETIKHVGSFDEVYRGWGFEEHDFICTLKKAGIKPKKCKAMPIHLYHQPWELLMQRHGRAAEQTSSRAANKQRYFNYANTGKK